jgi:predicted RecB family nuclease
MTTATKTPSPASLVHASEAAAQEAAAAYAKANAAAIEAQRVATQAQERAEAERHQRTVAYLDELNRTYAADRDTLTTAVGQARQDLESAVAGDGDASVFAAYLAWTRAVAAVHALEVELAETRNTLGQPARFPSDLYFSWSHDIAGIVDGLAMTAVDNAVNEARDRRAAFVSGGGKS